MVDAQAIAGAQVLIDPNPHDVATVAAARRGTAEMSAIIDRTSTDTVANLGSPSSQASSIRVAAPDRPRRRSLGVAQKPRRPAHHRLPPGGERIRRSVLPPAPRVDRDYLRGD